MKELLRQYLIEQVSSPKEEEIEEILSIFEAKEFKKGDYFKKPFTAGNEICFLTNGAVREIVFSENLEEVTAKIHGAFSFVADLYQLETDEISPIGTVCLEDQTLLVADFKTFQKLLDTNLALNITARKYLSEKMIEIGKQQLLFLTGSAKERYEFIINQYPEFLKKYPLKYIASMIGITPTQLSRLRSKK